MFYDEKRKEAGADLDKKVEENKKKINLAAATSADLDKIREIIKDLEE